MRISVDTNRCVGAGQCVLTAPEFFDQNDDAIVQVLSDTPDESARKLVTHAVELCPSGAITVHDD
jgi:ferredoxin